MTPFSLALLLTLPISIAWLPPSSSLVSIGSQNHGHSQLRRYALKQWKRRAVTTTRYSSSSSSSSGAGEEIGAPTPSSSSSPPLDLSKEDNGMNELSNSVIEAAKLAFGEVDFETDLDDATRKVYEDAIAAEFDRNVKDLEAVGEELKGESEESLRILTKAAEKNLADAEAASATINEYEQRVRRMTDRVKQETDNVAREVETLKALRDEIKNDPLLRLSNFREQGIPKQASLAGALLLFIRGGADGLSYLGTLAMGGDGGASYAQSAVLQVGLSLAALAFYLFF